jgi:carboxypeptidase Taq
MFLDKMERDVPEWRSSIREGNFSPVREWLRENIHSKGSLNDPADLVKVVTGKSITITPFLNYLGRKMDMIYG